MIDPKTLESELHHAHLARLEAEAEACEVEELISAVQHFRPGRQRLLFMVAGVEAEPFATAN
jgi:hypothetical protein